ncbi:MAG TPA: hypothetical protein VJT67_16505 [Longimicrobiaceae bacterium]|nr:hypothetical protein [Longimicrobiaceae bacterium]
MKRKRRVIETDFPASGMDMEAIRQGFRELRRERLVRERRARLAALRATAAGRRVGATESSVAASGAA